MNSKFATQQRSAKVCKMIKEADMQPNELSTKDIKTVAKRVQRRLEKLKRNESDSDEVISEASPMSTQYSQRFAKFKNFVSILSSAKASDAAISKVKEESFEANHK